MTRQEYSGILEKRGAFLCVECGKCAALCPMAETAAGFDGRKSPRGAVRQALAHAEAEAMPALASCLQCRACSATCPAGVDPAGLIADPRQASGAGAAAVCTACGAPLLPADAAAYLDRAGSAGFEEGLSYHRLCPACRRRAYARNNG